MSLKVGRNGTQREKFSDIFFRVSEADGWKKIRMSDLKRKRCKEKWIKLADDEEKKSRFCKKVEEGKENRNAGGRQIAVRWRNVVSENILMLTKDEETKVKEEKCVCLCHGRVCPSVLRCSKNAGKEWDGKRTMEKYGSGVCRISREPGWDGSWEKNKWLTKRQVKNAFAGTLPKFQERQLSDGKSQRRDSSNKSTWVDR